MFLCTCMCVYCFVCVCACIEGKAKECASYSFAGLLLIINCSRSDSRKLPQQVCSEDLRYSGLDFSTGLSTVKARRYIPQSAWFTLATSKKT